MRFKPSEVAAASIILSCRQLRPNSQVNGAFVSETESNSTSWTRDIEIMTGYTNDDLSEAINEIR
jgi:hypothetical protein